MWIIVMFLSTVWTISDGTHSLQSIHWWASDAMLTYIIKIISCKTHLEVTYKCKLPLKDAEHMSGMFSYYKY